MIQVCKFTYISCICLNSGTLMASVPVYDNSDLNITGSDWIALSILRHSIYLYIDDIHTCTQWYIKYLLQAQADSLEAFLPAPVIFGTLAAVTKWPFCLDNYF